MKLLETIDLAITQSENVNLHTKVKLKLSLKSIREQIESNNNLSAKEEEFYFETFHVQTENLNLNETLNTLLSLLCLYLSSHPINNSSQN